MLNTSELIDSINTLKRSGKKIFSNSYLNIASMSERKWDATVSQNSICIFNNDNGIKRVRFYTADFEDLGLLLSETNVTAEVISRNPEEYKQELIRLGFHVLARLQRRSNSDISSVIDYKSELVQKYGELHLGYQAQVCDVFQIDRILRSVFDTRVSHLPAKEELKTSINNGEIIINKSEGTITSILQRKISSGKFYINQVYNSGRKEIIHSIMLDELNKFHESGGKYVYAWVEDSNIASIKFHDKYGLSPDGLWDIVYVRD